MYANFEFSRATASRATQRTEMQSARAHDCRKSCNRRKHGPACAAQADADDGPRWVRRLPGMRALHLLRRKPQHARQRKTMAAAAQQWPWRWRPRRSPPRSANCAPESGDPRPRMSRTSHARQPEAERSPASPQPAPVPPAPLDEDVGHESLKIAPLLRTARSSGFHWPGKRGWRSARGLGWDAPVTL